MPGFGEVSLQTRDSGLGGQGMWPRELLEGLDVLLDAAEELVSVLDRNRLSRAVLDQPPRPVCNLSLHCPIRREPA